MNNNEAEPVRPRVKWCPDNVAVGRRVRLLSGGTKFAHGNCMGLSFSARVYPHPSGTYCVDLVWAHGPDYPYYYRGGFRSRTAARNHALDEIRNQAVRFARVAASSD